jgi:hypothetical protein
MENLTAVSIAVIACVVRAGVAERAGKVGVVPFIAARPLAVQAGMDVPQRSGDVGVDSYGTVVG